MLSNGMPMSAQATPVSVNKITPPEKRTGWEDRLQEHSIRGWRAVSIAGLQGNGSQRESVFVHRYRLL